MKSLAKAASLCYGSTVKEIIPYAKQIMFNLKRKMGVFVELALSEVFDFGFVWW
jgi:hypothetical protein